MLVLSRRRQQSIMIGDDIEVVVVDVRGDKVRLGVRAPENVGVHRREIFDQLTPTPSIAASEDQSVQSQFLRAAIDQARLSLATGGLPIGAVLVRGNQIIGRGHDRRMQSGDPMAHAEIVCLTNAGRQRTYKDTSLYCTLMPCDLCNGAIVQFRVPRVIVGDSVNDAGVDCTVHARADWMKSRGIEMIDLHDAECMEMLQQFIKLHPTIWDNEIRVD